MKRAMAVIFVIAAVFWTGIIILAKFPPTEDEIQLRYLAWSQATHTKVPDSFAREMPFPLPVSLLSLVPAKLLISHNYFRVPNLILGILALGILGLIILKTEPKLAGGTLAIAAVTPWLVWTAMSDFPAILTLLLALVTFAVALENTPLKFPPKLGGNKLLLGLLVLLISLTSLSGLIFGLIFGIWYLVTTHGRAEKIVTLILVVLITGGVTHHLWDYISGQSFLKTNGITAVSITAEVDQRVRNEYKLNQFQNVVPAKIKRIAYNKLYFGYRIVAAQVFNVFSLEKLAYPAESDATVTRSMWNSKELPWLLFWELILAGWGIYHLKELDPKLKSLCLIFFTWSITAMFFSGNNFLASGIGLVIPVAILAALAIKHTNKIILYIGGVIVLAGLAATYDYFLFNQLYWRDNRPQVQLTMAEMAVNHKANFVTTILGRSFFYYAWLIKMPPKNLWQDTENGNLFDNIKFDHFELKDKGKPAGHTYVGFPGEFLGDKKLDNRNDFSPKDLPKNYQLLDSYRPHDSVSFGNGDEIWTVRVN
jgi:ABC-type multidrug transport system fused ATPase/permease subunit